MLMLLLTQFGCLLGVGGSHVINEVVQSVIRTTKNSLLSVNYCDVDVLSPTTDIAG